MHSKCCSLTAQTSNSAQLVSACPERRSVACKHKGMTLRCFLALQESFEWADLRTLTDDEIKPHSQHPLPGLSKTLALPAPAQFRAKPSSPALAVPAVPGATPAQVRAFAIIMTDSSATYLRPKALSTPPQAVVLSIIACCARRHPCSGILSIDQQGMIIWKYSLQNLTAVTCCVC